MQKERRIIYVDATGVNGSDNFKIGIYDIGNNATHIMELVDIKDNNLAEKYAVYYAIFYIEKNNYENCMILSDNKSAVIDSIILDLLKDLKIAITWIPREINKVADSTCKREATLKENDRNVLECFINLAQKAYSNVDINIQSLKEENVKLKKQLEEKNTKIKNQAENITNLKKKVTTK